MNQKHKNSRSFFPVQVDHKWTYINFSIGCTLKCAYCIQQKDAEYNYNGINKQFSVASIMEQLKNYSYISKKQSMVIGNNSDPFLPQNLEDTLSLLAELDKAGYSGITGLITKVYPGAKSEDNKAIRVIKELKNLKPVLLVSYAGYTDNRVESAPSEDRLLLMKQAHEKNIPVILYLRPISKTWMEEPNESFESKIERVAKETKGKIDAVVYGGLYYNEEIQARVREIELPEPFNDSSTEKRYDSPHLQEQIKKIFNQINPEVPLFKSTSCGVSYTFKQPNFIGYYGLRSMESPFLECRSYCTPGQRDICREGSEKVTDEDVKRVLTEIGLGDVTFKNTPKAVRIHIPYDHEHVEYLNQNLSKYIIWDNLFKELKESKYEVWPKNLKKLGIDE
jgi:DNA repair photolyase